MTDYTILFDLAVIFFSAKMLGLLAQKLGVPQVAGEIVAGIIIGPQVLGLVEQSDFLVTMSELGVILLMYTAGLETNLHELLKTGLKSLIIACCGVFFPMLCGYGLYGVLYGFGTVGSDSFYEALFIGVILTATSVSITVAALKELGRLSSTAGTTIMGAAIIDDVIGMIVLTFVCGMKTPGTKTYTVIINTVLFFAFAVVVGFIIYKIFNVLSAKYPHHRRLTIYGLALCFAMAYIAEEFFGIADVTGAYVAGVMLCSIGQADYIAKRTETENYTIFSPLFFASIGIKTSISNMGGKLLVFTLLFIVIGMAAKVIGCGLSARVLKFNNKDSLRIGLGMMTRGEVALIVAQKALNLGALTEDFFAPVILLVVVSSIVTPVFLKMAYKGEPAA